MVEEFKSEFGESNLFFLHEKVNLISVKMIDDKCLIVINQNHFYTLKANLTKCDKI